MRRYVLSLVGALLLLILPTHANADILIVSPHPDDDVIIASGVIQRALQRGEIVRVVFVTNGDLNGVSEAVIREGEAVNGQAALGVAENRLIFLGYPDGYLNAIRVGYTTAGSAYLTPNNVSATYASRGLGGTDYHRFRFGSAGQYNWPTMVGDLADIIASNRPTHIFTTSQWDTHSDHSSTYHLVVQAALSAIAANPGYNPTIHKTTVWPGGDPAWPGPSDPLSYVREIPRDFVSDPAEMVWTERESLDVPSSSQSPLAPTNPKYAAIRAHVSQGGPDRYIGLWAHKDEFFWTEQLTGTNRPPVPNAGGDQEVGEGSLVTLDGSASWDRNGGAVTYQWRQVLGAAVSLSSATASRPTFLAPSGLAVDTAFEFELIVSDGSLSSVADGVRVVVRSALRPATFGPNVAPLASSFSSSSERLPSGQTAAKVADGYIDGVPNDATREWATQNEGVGAWVQLNWSSPRTLGKVVLYDRPNSDDQVLAGVLQFSDGSTLATGPLSNNAGPVTYTFPARSVTSLRFTVTQVLSSTANIGLAELQAFEAGSTNLPPVANAGFDQTAGGGQAVTLDGNQSSDPNHDPLTFTWSQTAGAAVTLTNAASPTPSFIAPPALPLSQTLRFSLVVSDGELTSGADTVEVRIPGTSNAPPTANAGADITVSPGGGVTLDGSTSSDPDGHALSYQWTQTGGTPVTLSNPTTARPSLVVPASMPDGSTLTYQLVVADGTDTSLPDAVVVNVSTIPSAINNIARIATVTASSENEPLQAAVKAIDGVINGYPVDSSREWATQAPAAGSWIELRWPAAHTVGLIRLHDRPNPDDQVRSGTLTFSSGASVPVPALGNDGSGTDVPFAPRQITWVRFTVDTVSPQTYRIGLSEMLVLETISTNVPPVAEAGANQNVSGGAIVQLTGAASSDPEGAALTYAWSQVSGPAVTLAGAATVNASFTAPAAIDQPQVLRFQLQVSDGSQTATDTVDVTVAAGALRTLSIGDVAVTEGNAGTVNAVFTVSLSGTSAQTITVNYATANGTATAAQDYTAASGTLTFAPNATTRTITVPILVDVRDEANETFVVNLSGASNATIADAQATGTITDDDAAPSLTIADVTVTEGNSGTVNAVFTATLSAASGQVVTVNYASANGTATAAQDYTAVSGTLTFAAGATTQTITIPILVDTRDEPNETFVVNLSAATNASIADAQATATITDDDPTPTLTIADVSVTEGNSATVNAVFTVTLSAASNQTVTVNFATANNTATAPQDYTARTTTALTFAAGTTSQTIAVAVAGETVNEVNETFFVNLSGAVNATIADTQAVGTIVNDDAVPTLAIGNVSVTETNAPGVNAVFTVTLSAASAQTVSVTYATANSTATAGADYTAAAPTVLSFAPGTTSRTVSVAIAGDTLDENDETFFVNLTTPVNATIADAQGVATIVDNDTSPSLSVNNVTVIEGSGTNVNAVFTVTLSAISGRSVTVNYATASNTATAGADFTAVSGTLTFAAGVTSQTVTVVTVGDALDEADESFFLNLTGAVNATIADTQGSGTITDNDATPSLRIGDVTVTETDGAAVNAGFAVTLSAASGRSVTVNYASASGTATSGQDFTAASGTLTFAVGVTSLTVNVPVTGDLLDEGTETFNVNLSGATNATITDTQGTGTINDNDPTPTLSINDVTVSEPLLLPVNATFTVRLSGASGRAVTVNYATANGSATAGQDYTSTSGTLTFAAGVTTMTVNVSVRADLTNEGNETFVVNLTAPTNATITDAQGTGTIRP